MAQDLGVSSIPHINLLCFQKDAAKAFADALTKYNMTSSVKYTVFNGSLSQLSTKVSFDLVVSPANSYGILDGGFDDAISRAWSPVTDYHALTRHVQSELYDQYRGMMPPGSCHIVAMPAAWRDAKLLKYCDGRSWNARYLASCPTMRMPSDCRWDREVVYECIWSLLGAIERQNRAIKDVGSTQFINSILMTPLGTGTGGLSLALWAEQTVLAIKHYVDAVQNGDKWKQLTWREAKPIDKEIQTTYDL